MREWLAGRLRVCRGEEKEVLASGKGGEEGERWRAYACMLSG